MQKIYDIAYRIIQSVCKIGKSYDPFIYFLIDEHGLVSFLYINDHFSLDVLYNTLKICARKTSTNPIFHQFYPFVSKSDMRPVNL